MVKKCSHLYNAQYFNIFFIFTKIQDSHVFGQKTCILNQTHPNSFTLFGPPLRPLLSWHGCPVWIISLGDLQGFSSSAGAVDPKSNRSEATEAAPPGTPYTNYFYIFLSTIKFYKSNPLTISWPNRTIIRLVCSWQVIV